MAVDLEDYAEVLRREITPPDTTLFEGVSDESLAGHLADAFWEARLDGFLKGWICDEDAIVTPIREGGPDIGREWIALLVLYAGIKIIRNRLSSTNMSFKAQAGPVNYEVRQSAMVMAELLRQLQETKNRLLEDSAGMTPTCLIDGTTIRSICPGSYGGYLSGLFYESFGPAIPTG